MNKFKLISFPLLITTMLMALSPNKDIYLLKNNTYPFLKSKKIEKIEKPMTVDEFFILEIEMVFKEINNE